MSRALVTARVLGRPGLERLTAADVRIFRPCVALTSDGPSERVCEELRIHSHDRATLETRSLFDFDPVKNRWATYGPARFASIEGRAAVKKQAAAMLARIESAGLERYHASTAMHETYFPKG